jgi:methylated-DNA-[protein]-cysteine S-methyltransferase
MKHYQRFIEIPIGRLTVICDNEAIISIYFTNDVSMNDNNDHPLLLQLEKELDEYFMGKRTVFTLPLNPNGTAFQKEVWKTLQNIPYGTSISYAEEAIRFGNPKAVRAVANANGKNPIAILIPCHRVIATGGGLGGYSGGLWRKEFLLALEKKSIKKV